MLFSLDSSNSQQFVTSVSIVKSGIYSCIILRDVIAAIKKVNKHDMNYIFQKAFQKRRVMSLTIHN